MSAIAKLMQARAEFHKRALKKTGKNTYSNFDYLQLSDFLIPAIEIFASLKLAALTSFTQELATMTITDLEDGTSLQITSPFGSAALKACHEVQNIGAVETYQRRYLWVAALEIVEHDAIDASEGVKKDTPLPAPINPNDIGKNFWNNAAGEQKECLESYLRTLLDYLDNADFGPEAASIFFYTKLHDLEEASAVWSQLNSKQRAAIKAHKPATIAKE